MEYQEYCNLISNLEEFKSSNKKVYDISSYEPKFREFIDYRLAHCEQNLRDNLAHASIAMNGQMVVWEGGVFRMNHFSWPVYHQLQEAKKQKIEKWNQLVWEQIIRQMARESDVDPILFDIASENCMLDGIK